jgi:hypothetical protein
MQSLPQSIWPLTVTGWVSLFLATSSAIGVVYALHRFSLRPYERDLGETKATLRKEAQDGKDDMSTSLSLYRAAVSAELNGYGVRLANVETTYRENQETINGILQSLVETRQDRKYMGESLARIERSVDEMRRDLQLKFPRA